MSRRPVLQSAIIRPVTERLLRDAGLAPGLRAEALHSQAAGRLQYCAGARRA